MATWLAAASPQPVLADQQTPMMRDGALRRGGVICRKHKILATLMERSGNVSMERFQTLLNQLTRKRLCDVAPADLPLTIEGYVKGYPADMRVLGVKLKGNNNLPRLYILETHLVRYRDERLGPASQGPGAGV